MGISNDCVTRIFGDAMLVINNTSKPESVSKQKNNAVCCHTVCESVAIGDFLTTRIDGNENSMDIMTKVVTGGDKNAF